MSESNVKIYASKDWVLEQIPDGPFVSSVNGKTGEIVISASDIGATAITPERIDEICGINT